MSPDLTSAVTIAVGVQIGIMLAGVFFLGLWQTTKYRPGEPLPPGTVSACVTPLAILVLILIALSA